jgi:hypothetical protein
MTTQVTEISLRSRVSEPTLFEHVRPAFTEARGGISKLDPTVLDMPGMSGRLYRMFVNNLIRRLHEPRYLEVGAWAGSTLCAAINSNMVNATVIDDWSEFGGPREAFLTNVARFATPGASVQLFEGDFRHMDFAQLKPCDVYLFDGPHEEQDHYDGIAMALSALKQNFVLIVDDWNCQRVRDGTWRALHALHLDVQHTIEVRTTDDGTVPDVTHQHSDWHNGYFIGVLRKAG